MRTAAPRRVALWACILASLAGIAAPASGTDDDELAEQLAIWQDEPLDLQRASVDELTRLPWLTRPEAESIIGLRSEGGLRSLEDLRQVPGLDAGRIAALRPFVAIEGPSEPLRFTGDLQSERPADGSHLRHRARIHASRGGLALWTLQRWHQRRPRRRWAGAIQISRCRLWVGNLRPRLGAQLLVAPPGVRSRTAARSPTFTMELGPGLAQVDEPRQSIGLRWAARQWTGLAVWGSGGVGRSALLAMQRSFDGALVLGLALHRRPDGRQDLGVWAGRREGREWFRADIVWTSDGAMRLAAAAEFRAPGTRIGAAITAAGRGQGHGVDPIGGAVLDRPHRSAQLHVVRRWWNGSAQFLLRRVERGFGIPDPRTRIRLEIRGRVRPHSSTPLEPGRWMVEVGTDRQSGSEDPPELGLRLRWSEDATRSSWGRSVFLSLRWSEGGGRQLFGAGLLRSGRIGVRLQGAAATGSASSLWVTGLGIAGSRGIWLRPGGCGARAVLEARLGASRGALWVGVEGAREISARFCGGLSIRWER